MPPAPDITTEEWANMAQAAAQPGIPYHPGFRERFTSVTQSLRDRKILGRPLYEVVADFGAGFVVKSAVRSGVILAGASTLGAIGAAVVAGAASGATFAGGKEWVRQARENWQQPLSPEAITTRQQILERVKDLTPNDWIRLGQVTVKGAIIGAAFGLAGGLFAEVLEAGAAPSSEEVTPSPSPEASPAPEPSATPSPLAEPQANIPIPSSPDIAPSLPEANLPTAPTVEVIPSATPELSVTPSPFTEPLATATAEFTPSANIPIPSSPDIAPSLPEANLPTAPTVEVIPSATPTVTETVTSGQVDIPAPQGETPLPTQTPTPPSEMAAPTQPTDVAPAQPAELPPPPAETPTEPGDTSPPSSEPLPPPLDTITEGVQNLQDISLEAGSNPWQVATEILKQVDPNHVPTNAEILEVTKAICEQNDISVPEWNISGDVDHRQIPIGYLLKINPEVKSVIASVAKGGK